MERIEKALKGLLIQEPFYGVFCMNLNKSLNPSIETLRVGRKNLSLFLEINPDFFCSVSLEEQIQLLKHELLHICFGHLFSFQQSYLMNIAEDFEVNSYIKKLNYGLFPEDFGWERCKGTKWYYEQLVQKGSPDKPNPKNQNGYSSETVKGPLGNTLDSHDWDKIMPENEDERTIMKDRIENLIRQTAEEYSKTHGSVPNEMKIVLDRISRKPPKLVNWREIFRRYLGTIWSIEKKPTKLRENVRFPDNPGKRTKRKASLFVAIDTSGSLGVKDFKIFLEELHNVWEEGCRITIMYCDAKCYEPFEYKGQRIDHVVGRGGTDFHPAIDYFIKVRKNYSTMIYCTDGCADIPKNCPKNMIWVLTPDYCKQNVYPGKKVVIPKK